MSSILPSSRHHCPARWCASCPHKAEHNGRKEDRYAIDNGYDRDCSFAPSRRYLLGRRVCHALDRHYPVVIATTDSCVEPGSSILRDGRLDCTEKAVRTALRRCRYTNDAALSSQPCEASPRDLRPRTTLNGENDASERRFSQHTGIRLRGLERCAPPGLGTVQPRGCRTENLCG